MKFIQKEGVQTDDQENQSKRGNQNDPASVPEHNVFRKSDLTICKVREIKAKRTN